jgi:hypothetical protein
VLYSDHTLNFKIAESVDCLLDRIEGKVRAIAELLGESDRVDRILKEPARVLSEGGYLYHSHAVEIDVAMCSSRARDPRDVQDSFLIPHRY